MSAGRPENLKIRSVKLSWQFDTGGVNFQIYPKSENLNFFLVLHVHHHRSFHIYYTKDLINQSMIVEQ